MWWEPRIPAYTTADLANRDEVPNLLDLIDLRLLFPHLRETGYKVPCQWHKDVQNPSMTIFRHNAYCFSCRKSLGALDAIHEFCKTGTRAQTFAIARHLLARPETRPVPVDTLGALPESILDPYRRGMQRSYQRWQWLREKYGLSPEAQAKLDIGYTGKAFAFPIRTLAGAIMNIRFRRCPLDWPDLERPADLPVGMPWKQLPRYFGKSDRTTPMWYLPLLHGSSLRDALLAEYGKDTVIVTEGEMDAGALAAELHLPGISITNGCGAWKHADIDLHFLMGCTVVVWYDNDARGEENGVALTAELKKLGIRAWQARTPQQYGKDAGDLVAKGWTRNQVVQLLLPRH